MEGEILAVILNVAVLAFVVTSMLAMGFSLTIPSIVEPLKNVRLVLLALAANFVLVPLVGWGLTELLDLTEGYEVGLLVMATAAGAPFLPKLAQAAKGNIAFSVGLMVLLMVVTIIYMPIVLPLMLSGVEVDAMAIASSLFWMMLVPLAIGLFFKARYPGVADTLHPQMSRASSMSLILLLVAGLLANFTDILDTIGTGAIITIVVFLLIALVTGYFSGGSDAGVRSVLGLGTAQRNLSAALIVAAQNFSDDPDVIVFIMVAAILGLILLMAAGGELGRRAEKGAAKSHP
jgi:BASS family bile acid:Na+ symporter